MTDASGFTFAAQDAAALGLVAFADSQLAHKRPPTVATLTGIGVGVAAWELFGKQWAKKHYQTISGEQLGSDVTAAGLGAGFAAFGDIVTDVEDNLAIFLLARPGIYLASLALTGYLAGDALTLPQYLTIAVGGAGGGSVIRNLSSS